MNRHASVVALGATGILIEGRSGTGKTSLALTAIEDTKRRGLFAALVADDQTLIEAVHGRLIASCPQALTGLAERRGLGIVKCPGISSVVVDIVIFLVEPEELVRMPQNKTIAIAGLDRPVFELPARQIAVSLPLIYQILENRRV